MRKSAQSTFSRIARTALAGAVCLGSAGITSCFQTRDAVPPTVVGDSPVTPLTVYDVLYNMQLAVNYRNPVFYEELFTADFVFKPDPSDSVEVEKDFPGAYAGWGYDVETEVMEHILDPVRCKYASLELHEETEVIVDESDTTSVIQRDYTLLIRHETSVGYYGTTRVFLKKLPDGYWYIEKYVDYLNEAQETSWGRLKGETRARM